MCKHKISKILFIIHCLFHQIVIKDNYDNNGLNLFILFIFIMAKYYEENIIKLLIRK